MLNNKAIRSLRWLDANVEKTVILVAYTACAAIIAIEVFRRFFWGEQVAWSTTVPAYMFIWLTWPGAAYGVKVRAHLAFTEVRQRLPRVWQYVGLQLDYLLFIVFGCVAIYFSYDLLLVQIKNGTTVPGTVNLPAWWFYLATPIGWALLLFRVVQNAIEDYRAYFGGHPLNLGGGISALD